jgi:hypothetical protein
VSRDNRTIYLPPARIANSSNSRDFVATPEQLAIIPELPRIMRDKGWDVAAHLMQSWQDGKAHDFAPYEAPPHLRRAYLSSLRMDWILSFSRARAVFDTLFQHGPLADAEVWKKLYGLVYRIGLADGRYNFGFTGQSPRTIELNQQLLATKSAGTLLRQYAAGAADWDIPETRFPQVEIRIPEGVPFIGGRRRTVGGGRITPRIPVGSGLDQVSQIITLDGLSAALARFTMCVTADGVVEYRKGKIHSIAVTFLGVYVRDSFDFVGGSQPLGAWRINPSDVTFAPLNLIPKLGDGWVWLDNQAFQDWRAQRGRGMDFIVYSDVRRVPMASPITVTFV